MSFHPYSKENKISNVKLEKTLVIFDSRLCDDKYVSNECKTANKLDVLAIVSSYMGQDKKRTLFNPYFVSI